ncbi:hypothetical protein AOE01nite_12540 [Acetobacter oeni]|uniref:Uncharacterized protein n=1 Tax=Acetobacter oeni TaxID=304077 RepID=A0A511XJA3_9PROT|nr:hypothetical protein AA21952_2002 [Acetobacter oeni LMG 21952]GEN63030.1 hypothetical protein AOE01nite_12540 [Acetobacter oeni]
MPSVSPGRGCRVVMDTECFSRGSAARSAFAMVDFPAPEGAEMTKQTPRRETGEGGEGGCPLRIIAAFMAPASQFPAPYSGTQNPAGEPF